MYDYDIVSYAKIIDRGYSSWTMYIHIFREHISDSEWLCRNNDYVVYLFHKVLAILYNTAFSQGHL